MQRVRRKSARPEDAIQRAVFQHLKVRKAINVCAFHVPNGGYRKPIEAAILKGLGVTAGMPDIIAIRNGQCFALELKTEKGNLTNAQSATLQRLHRAGAVIGIAYGLDEALRWLEQNGILKGRTA